jgi:hypothetical protein
MRLGELLLVLDKEQVQIDLVEGDTNLQITKQNFPVPPWARL